MVPIQRNCDVESLADFHRYYQGSWVGWHPSDATHITPCYVGNPALSGESISFRPMSKTTEGKFTLNGGYYASWPDIREHVDFGVPDVGMLPDGPTILYCSFTSPRAARKGFRYREMRTVDFNGWDIRKKYQISRGNERYDWTWFAFNPEYKSLVQAEEILSKGEAVGVPLSRTLGVYSLPKFKYSLLAYKRWTIGHVISPSLVNLKLEYADYEEDIARQTGAEVLVG